MAHHADRHRRTAVDGLELVKQRLVVPRRVLHDDHRVLGLLHGLGFAALLTQYGLPKDNFISMLLAFNLGVEFGQLAVLVIAFVLINNTIRLSVYAKRFLIRTMKLVGAQNLFIQKPFMIKSIYQGVYSSIFAIFMLIGSIKLIQRETAQILNITDLKIIGLVFMIIFISGVIISWSSTFFAVRKYMDLKESELYN